MRWLPAGLVGLVTGAITAFVGAYAADLGTRWHRVPDMEGQRGMAIAFLFIPLAFVVGLVVGIVVARRGGDVGSFAAGLARLAKAVGVALGLVAVTLGFAWLTTNHPPTIDGQELVLEWEMRLPPGFTPRDSLSHHDFRVGLVASADDRDYTRIRFDQVAQDDSFVVVTGSGYLRSRASRSLSMTWGPFDAHNPVQFVELPLAPVPSRRDMAWTDWMPLTQYMDLTPVPAERRALVRYRVSFAKDVLP